MSETIENLQPASFRGIPFLVNAETEIGGKKSVTHEYVGSDKRFTEDTLGLLPPRFTLECIVQDPDAIAKRNNLIGVLNLPGVGTLVHPIYGDIDVKSTTYTVSSSQNAIGEFRFTIPFERSEEVVTTTIAIETFPSVQDKAEECRETLDEVFEEVFVGPKLPEELIKSAEQAENIYDEILEASQGALNTVREKVSTFTRFVADSKSKVLTIAQLPFSMKDNLESLYSSALDIVNAPRDLYDMWNNLIDFGFLDLKLPVITESRRTSEGNRSALREHTRISALINSYEAGSNREYQTTDEINAARTELDTAYRRIMEEYDDDLDSDNLPVLAEDPDLRTAMASLRTGTMAVLNEKEQNAWRVVEIDPGQSSMALTSHRYYGNLDNLDIIRELNPDVNNASFEQAINAIGQ
jgi:prophage DNA circulation protein